jgi:hypothetical protein
LNGSGHKIKTFNELKKEITKLNNSDEKPVKLDDFAKLCDKLKSQKADEELEHDDNLASEEESDFKELQIHYPYNALLLKKDIEVMKYFSPIIGSTTYTIGLHILRVYANKNLIEFKLDKNQEIGRLVVDNALLNQSLDNIFFLESVFAPEKPDQGVSNTVTIHDCLYNIVTYSQDPIYVENLKKFLPGFIKIIFKVINEKQYEKLLDFQENTTPNKNDFNNITDEELKIISNFVWNPCLAFLDFATKGKMKEKEDLQLELRHLKKEEEKIIEEIKSFKETIQTAIDNDRKNFVKELNKKKGIT